jgi:hypothetical protein
MEAWKADGSFDDENVLLILPPIRNIKDLFNKEYMQFKLMVKALESAA